LLSELKVQMVEAQTATKVNRATGGQMLSQKFMVILSDHSRADSDQPGVVGCGV